MRQVASLGGVTVTPVADMWSRQPSIRLLGANGISRFVLTATGETPARRTENLIGDVKTSQLPSLLAYGAPCVYGGAALMSIVAEIFGKDAN